MTLKPCLRCGEPTPRTHCEQHQPKPPPKSPRDYGYDAAWDRLSKRARRLQPFCTDCGSTEDLQADHTPAAWQRKEQGLAIRLQDIAVRCGPCNRAAGAARGKALTRGDAPRGVTEAPVAKAEFESLTPSLPPVNGDLTQRVNREDIRLGAIGEHDHFSDDQHVAERTDRVVVRDIVAKDVSQQALVQLPTLAASEVCGQQLDAAVDPCVESIFIHDRSLA